MAPKKKPAKGNVSLHARLEALGSGPRTAASKALETFPNPNPGRDYLVRMEIPEFT